MPGLEFDPKAIEELWKKDVTKKQSWKAGMFEYEVKIVQDFTNEELDEVCEWLAHNCKANFIALLKTNETLAGGSTNNLVSWNNRQNQGIYSQLNKTLKLHIRLYSEDVVAFRLRWIP